MKAQSPLFINLFGESYMIMPSEIDLENKTTKIHPDQLVPLLSGFKVGVSCIVYPIQKFLAKANSNFGIRLIERIEKDLWRYTFSLKNSDWKIVMDVPR